MGKIHHFSWENSPFLWSMVHTFVPGWVFTTHLPGADLTTALVHHDHGICHGEEVTRSTDHQNSGHAQLFEEGSDLSWWQQMERAPEKCHLKNLKCLAMFFLASNNTEDSTWFDHPSLGMNGYELDLNISRKHWLRTHINNRAEYVLTYFFLSNSGLSGWATGPHFSQNKCRHSSRCLCTYTYAAFTGVNAYAYTHTHRHTRTQTHNYTKTYLCLYAYYVERRPKWKPQPQKHLHKHGFHSFLKAFLLPSCARRP